MDIELIAVLAPMLLNFVLLFNRRKKWAKSYFRWIVVFIAFCAGIIPLLSGSNSIIEVPKIVAWGLMAPMIFSLTDMGFRRLSNAVHNRDLYLWLRGSSEIDTSKLSGGMHVKASDRIFSMVMLFLIVFLAFIGILIFE